MSDEGRDTDGESNVNTQPNGGAPAQQTPGQVAAQPSYGDLVTSPLTKRFAKFSTGVYAAVAVGLGVMFLALKLLGKQPVTDANSGQQSANAADVAATQFVNTSAQFAIYLLPLLAAALAVVVGLYAARELDVGDRKLYVAASVGSVAGAFVFVVLAGFLVTMAFGTASTADGVQMVSKPGSIDVGNLLFNAVAVAIGAGVLTLGTVWTDRTVA